MKLLGQIIAAIVLICFDVRLEFITNPITGAIFDLGWIGYPITLLWLVGVSNAVNLIDGLDGLASGGFWNCGIVSGCRLFGQRIYGKRLHCFDFGRRDFGIPSL